MEDLEAVMYRSQAVRPMERGELDRLLIDARRFNERVRVSGVLLHHQGVFLQYFEGPPQAVAQVYDRIKRSDLHGRVAELMYRPIGERQFAKWDMGFCQAPATVLEELANESWALVLPAVRDRQQHPQGMQLLLDFWDWAAQQRSA